jgi:hypothetical protein
MWKGYLETFKLEEGFGEYIVNVDFSHSNDSYRNYIYLRVRRAFFAGAAFYLKLLNSELKKKYEDRDPYLFNKLLIEYYRHLKEFK